MFSNTFSLEGFWRSLQLSPINVALSTLLVYFVYTLITQISAPPPEPPRHKAATLFKDYTPKELSKFNGVDSPKVFLAVRGKVYDVTRGKRFYGPGGPYSNFAGRDASRGLAYNSFSDDVLTPLDQPIDRLHDLSKDEKQSLDDWEETFIGKYDHVGNLVNPA